VALTQERLKEVLYYHPESGDFVRLVALCGRALVGQQVGTPDAAGYLTSKIDGKTYKLHRLAFLYVLGRWPDPECDHRDMVKNNNEWSNLREASLGENRRNVGPRKGNTTGIKGIRFDRRRGTYVVDLQTNKQRHNYSGIKTLEEAIEVCAQLLVTFHGEFARAA
jgi:hypothetical protein